MRGWNTLNRDKVRERNRRYKIDKPQQYKDSKLRTNFGIGLARYEEMLAAQNGLCAACGGENQVAHRRLAVDHCHRTGRMRALLCGNCNTAIGLVHESVDRLNALITYLRTHENG